MGNLEPPCSSLSYRSDQGYPLARVGTLHSDEWVPHTKAGVYPTPRRVRTSH